MSSVYELLPPTHELQAWSVIAYLVCWFSVCGIVAVLACREERRDRECLDRYLDALLDMAKEAKR